jgi:tetratricopeptide (TPR) repeat protein
MGDLTQAEASLEAAVWAAEAGGHDEFAARAWVALVFLVGHSKQEHARGLAFAPRATAAIARVGGSADIESSLEEALGAIAVSQGRFHEGVAHYQRAVALAEKAFGPDDSRLAISVLNLGIAVMNGTSAAQAVPILQRGLDIQERVLGPHHPDVARTLGGLGRAHNEAGRPALAEQLQRRALAILERTLEPNHPALAKHLTWLADALHDQGRADEAVVFDRRAAAIAENGTWSPASFARNDGGGPRDAPRRTGPVRRGTRSDTSRRGDPHQAPRSR